MKHEAIRDPLEELAEEFLACYRNGERPAVGDYADRNPAIADQVRTTFPTLVLMEDLASSGEGSLSHSCGSGLGATEDAPEQLGDFRIIREIGRGGMGIVYEAEQLCLNRRVAVKVLPPSVSRRGNNRTRFHREAQSAAKLHHTNIVPVIGVGEEQGVQYYAMQFIDGRGLDRVLLEMSKAAQRDETWVKRASLISGIGTPFATDEAHAAPTEDRPNRHSADETDDTASAHLADTEITPRPMADDSDSMHNTVAGGRPQSRYWDRVAKIGVQVSDALEHSHSHGILHRDIKPGNLLLDGEGTVWITDFGLARSDDEADNVTAAGEMVGTLRYSAPEQIEGNPDKRSDVYSLGLTLYELLALQPAFAERNRNRLAKEVMQGDVQPLRKIDPEIPRDLETIVHKAIRRDPALRYQTARELTDDLRRYLEGEPIQARRATISERVWRWCRRNPTIARSVATSAVAIVLTLSAAIFLINRARTETKDALVATQNALAREEKLKKESDRVASESGAVSEFLVLDMIGAAKPERTQGRQVTVREMLDRAASRVGERFAGHPSVEAAVRHSIGMAYFRLGDFESARIHWSTALDLRRKVSGPEHLATLKAMRHLAASLNSVGRDDEGHALQTDALAILKRVFGPNHRETLEAIGDLGVSLVSREQYDEAMIHLTDARDRKQTTLGPNDPSTLQTMSQLAVAMQHLGRLEDAEELLRRTWKLQQTVQGNDHPDTLATKGSLAANLVKQNRDAEAERLNQELFESRVKVLGPDHPDTLTTILNLAGNLERMNQAADIHRLYNVVYTRLKTTLGPHHPRTLKAANDLAWNTYLQREDEEARRIFENLLDVAKKKLGVTHHLTRIIQNNLAKVIRAAPQGPIQAARKKKQNQARPSFVNPKSARRAPKPQKDKK